MGTIMKNNIAYANSVTRVDALTDVSLTNLTNNQILTYDEETSKWVNADTCVLPDNIVIDPIYVHTDNNYNYNDKYKLTNIEEQAEVNIIESVKVNNSVLTITDKTVNVEIPTNISYFTNDSEFITSTVDNLSNYYSKTSTYNKDEVNSLLNNVSSLNILIVDELPTTDISTHTIYLIAQGNVNENDNYDEYINIDGTDSGWEHIGSTSVDLSNYYTKVETDNLLINKVDIIPGKSLSDNNYTNTEKTKLENISDNAEVNVINTVKINNVEQVITNKELNFSIPTSISDLYNDENYISDSNYHHTDNNFTNEYKEQLDTFKLSINEDGSLNLVYFD